MNTEHSKIPFTVVLLLGAISLLLSAGLLILAYEGRTIDGGLYTLAGGAVGGLSAVLANTRPTSQQNATGTLADPVTVATAPDNPLETTPATGDKP